MLREKYLMEAEEAELLSSFLMPMMHYYPQSRATAAEMVNHPWLRGVTVLGEEEIADRQRSSEGLANLAGGTGSGTASGTATARTSTSTQGGQTGPAPAPADGAQNGDSALEEVAKLGPAVHGMVGMGRI